MSKSTRLSSMVVIIMLASALAPALAFAGGDQVNRPDGSGTGDQQAEGVLPDWAPREQQSEQP